MHRRMDMETVVGRALIRRGGHLISYRVVVVVVVVTRLYTVEYAIWIHYPSQYGKSTPDRHILIR